MKLLLPLVAIATTNATEKFSWQGNVRKLIDLSDAEKIKFVEAHNSWRNKAANGLLNGNKKATKMSQLRWDDELAENSKLFAEKCILKHSTEVNPKFTDFDNVDYHFGENLAVDSRFFEEDFASHSVDPWAEEHEFYNHDTLQCSKPPCGHYTMVVWESTTRVGCAVAHCNFIREFNRPGTNIVCQYYGPGNASGQKPYTYAEQGQEAGEECTTVQNGNPTGVANIFSGLCNNKNTICTADNRCSKDMKCDLGTNTIAGEITNYNCVIGDQFLVTEPPFIEPKVCYKKFKGKTTKEDRSTILLNEFGSYRPISRETDMIKFCNLDKDCKGFGGHINRFNSLQHTPLAVVTEENLIDHDDDRFAVSIKVECQVELPKPKELDPDHVTYQLDLLNDANQIETLKSFSSRKSWLSKNLCFTAAESKKKNGDTVSFKNNSKMEMQTCSKLNENQKWEFDENPGWIYHSLGKKKICWSIKKSKKVFEIRLKKCNKKSPKFLYKNGQILLNFKKKEMVVSFKEGKGVFLGDNFVTSFGNLDIFDVIHFLN